MKESKLNVENLSKADLLMLFSVLEGELEARDLVIDTLKAQRTDLYTQQRYGRYSLSDPFLALQRDSEAVGGQRETRPASAQASNPLVVLRLVVSHCRGMQEKMLAQLAAAESRHRMVIADLEEEKRRHAEDTAEGDDVTYILEKERERLIQQLEFERGRVRRLEKEQRRTKEVQEEERAQHRQLSCALAKECKWASSRALEEGQRLGQMSLRLDEEEQTSRALRQELEEERRRALRMEARVEEQLAEFDTEREQLRSRLRKEEAHCSRLKEQVAEQRRTTGLEGGGGGGGEREEEARCSRLKEQVEEQKRMTGLGGGGGGGGERQEETTGACSAGMFGETNSGQEQKHLWAEPVRSKVNGHPILKGISGKHVFNETTNGKQDLKETNGKIDLQEINGHHDLKEPSVMCPSTQPSVMCPSKQPSVICPSKQSSVICPSKQPSLICPSKESSVICPSTEPSLICPSTEPSLICPSTEPSLICPSKQASVMCPSKESSVICPSKQSSGICPSTEPSVICPSKESSIICPSTGSSVICPSAESSGNRLSVESSGNRLSVENSGNRLSVENSGNRLSVENSGLPTKDDQQVPERIGNLENGCETHASPSTLHPRHLPQDSSSSSSSLLPGLSSPGPSSPVQPPSLRPPGSPNPSGYQSSYQAGVHQRFHSARHRFQGVGGEPEQPLSPRDPSPEPGPVRQLARSTVTQVLSRFATVQQSAAAKLPGAVAMANSSPFGTDYRNLAPPSPVVARSSSATPLPPQGGPRSPAVSRAGRGHPPPVPPKKPGLAQSPPSPALGHRAPARVAELSGNCGPDSGGVEPEAVDESCT